jgi:energy-coupling factor transporter transmembrane protein EcfT
MLRRQSGVEQGLKRVLYPKLAKRNPANYPVTKIDEDYGMFLARAYRFLVTLTRVCRRLLKARMVEYREHRKACKASGR